MPGRRLMSLTMVLGLFVVQAGAAVAGPPEKACLKKLEDAAAFEHKRIDLYLAEMKNMTGNSWAKNAMSTCGGALSRAQQFFKKNLAAESVCTAGSSYVDSQVVHLYRSAGGTCRAEIDRLAQQMPGEDKQRLIQRIAQKEAEYR